MHVISVKLDAVTKSFSGNPATIAMAGLDLSIEEGEFVVLLGPSGCGKTTTLRCVAGLERPDSGRIRLGAADVFNSTTRTDLPPDKRNIGMIFQSYALWPHMTVRKNIGYPLRARRIRSAESRSWVEDTARLVEVDSLLGRYPSQLSGGQQQRVALARGLVAQPDVVLFDEPLSNLDARLRDSVRGQIHELHGRLGFTAIFVTHDQREALALGTRMAVMNAGRFEQVGPPQEVFEKPASDYVAGFIGMSNRLVLKRGSGGWHVTDAAAEARLALDVGTDEVILRFRPEDISVGPPGTESTQGRFDGDGLTVDAEFVDAQFGGSYVEIALLVGGERLLSRVPSGRGTAWSGARGHRVTATIRLSAASVFTPDGRRVEWSGTPMLASVPS